MPAQRRIRAPRQRRVDRHIDAPERAHPIHTTRVQWGTAMDVPEPCGSHSGTDLDRAMPRIARRRSRRAVGRRGARRRAPRGSDGARADRPGVAGRSHSLTAMPRRRTLPAAGDGTKLPEMVGAVIYVRVSTKEQTENLSLPTQLRACEEYCRRQGYDDPRTLPRRRRERQDHGPQPAPGAAEVLPHAQGQGPLRRRLQPHAIRAGEVRPLRAARAPEVARHFAAVGHRADRRHLHRQADGRRAGRVRAVRQRRALGSDARRHEGRAGTRTLDVPGAARLPQRAEVVEHEPRARPGTRAARAAGVRGSGDGPVHEAGSDRPRDRSRTAQPEGPDAVATELRPDDAEPDLRREGREPGLRRLDEGRLRAARRRGHVLPRPGRPRRPRRRRRSAPAEPSGLPAARLRALRDVRPAAHRQLVEGPQRPLRVLPLPDASAER